MEFNIIKLAFLLGYLALLVCVVSGIPFLTALFRSVLVTVVFSLGGFFIRIYFLRVVNSIETRLDKEYAESQAGAYGTEAGEKEAPDTAGVAAKADYED